MAIKLDELQNAAKLGRRLEKLNQAVAGLEAMQDSDVVCLNIHYGAPLFNEVPVTVGALKRTLAYQKADVQSSLQSLGVEVSL